MTRKVVLIAIITGVLSGCASTLQRDGAITIVTDAKGWDAMNRGHIGVITETKHNGSSPSPFWENQNFWTGVLMEGGEHGIK
jgi:uncharacterized protein YceK